MVLPKAAAVHRRRRRQGPDPALDRSRPPPGSRGPATAQVIRQRVPATGPTAGSKPVKRNGGLRPPGGPAAAAL